MAKKSDYYFKKYLGIFIGSAFLLAIISATTSLSISAQTIALVSAVITAGFVVWLELLPKRKK